MRRGPWPHWGRLSPDGLPTSELSRKHGLSPATFYKLKAKFGGMDLSDAKRRKQLEDAKLKGNPPRK